MVLCSAMTRASAVSGSSNGPFWSPVPPAGLLAASLTHPGSSEEQVLGEKPCPGAHFPVFAEGGGLDGEELGPQCPGSVG